MFGRRVPFWGGDTWCMNPGYRWFPTSDLCTCCLAVSGVFDCVGSCLFGRAVVGLAFVLIEVSSICSGSCCCCCGSSLRCFLGPGCCSSVSMRLVKASMVCPCLCSEAVSHWSTCVDSAVISWVICWTSDLSSRPRSFRFCPSCWTSVRMLDTETAIVATAWFSVSSRCACAMVCCEISCISAASCASVDDWV